MAHGTWHFNHTFVAVDEQPQIATATNAIAAIYFAAAASYCCLILAPSPIDADATWAAIFLSVLASSERASTAPPSP
jgi:hypothetical protein